MPRDALIAHYHEVGLKGRNREFFEEALVRNLKRALRGTGYKRARRLFGRILVEFQDGSPLEEANARAARVFGIAYVGLGRVVEPDMDALAATALALIRQESFESFSVRARRAYSAFPSSSLDINVHVGQYIKDATGARVDLGNPEATAYIELFGKTGIVFCRRTTGPGGLPVGVSGRLLALISGGIDSPVAAWRMMRRGAEVELLHFHGQPYTDPSSIRQTLELAEVLARYQLRCSIHLVPLADAQREIVATAPAGLRVVLYRRAMLRIAERLAEEVGTAALVTGDALGQVASQTMENLATVDAAAPSVRILRPLIGMDKQEIVDTARRIGTYEISTRKYQDCCVLFQPRTPATRSTVEQVERAEAELDVDALVGKALAGVETRKIELAPPEQD